MSRFLDDALGDEFDTHGRSSFYGTCDPGIIGWDADIVFVKPISEQYGEHMTFKHVQDAK